MTAPTHHQHIRPPELPRVSGVLLAPFHGRLPAGGSNGLEYMPPRLTHPVRAPPAAEKADLRRETCTAQDLSHIDGMRVVQGEMQDVTDLLEIFTALTQHNVSLADQKAQMPLSPSHRRSALASGTSLSALYEARGSTSSRGGLGTASSPKPSSALKRRAKPAVKAQTPSAAAMRSAADALTTSLTKKQQTKAAGCAKRIKVQRPLSAPPAGAPKPWKFSSCKDVPWADPIPDPLPPKRSHQTVTTTTKLRTKQRPVSANAQGAGCVGMRTPLSTPLGCSSTPLTQTHRVTNNRTGRMSKHVPLTPHVGMAAALDEAAVEEAIGTYMYTLSSGCRTRSSARLHPLVSACSRTGRSMAFGFGCK